MTKEIPQFIALTKEIPQFIALTHKPDQAFWSTTLEDRGVTAEDVANERARLRGVRQRVRYVEVGWAGPKALNNWRHRDLGTLITVKDVGL